MSIKTNVHQLELVNAISEDNTDSIVSAILKGGHEATPYGSPLHLLAALSPKPTIIKIIDAVSCANWINIKNSDSETPLHIASRLSRHELVERLFQIPNVDDTIRDKLGKTAEELAQSDRMVDIFAAHKTSFINAFYASLLEFTQDPVSTVDNLALLFQGNRTKSYLSMGWIDVNYPIQPIKERTILHLAAKRDDANLVKFILQQNADPAVKDLNGKKPTDLTKSDRVKDILKNVRLLAPIKSAIETQAAFIENHSMSAPVDALVLKEKLLKWTNYTSGYQPRFFVLEKGKLSYFIDPSEYPLTSRGSIATVSCQVTYQFDDKSRFDISGSGGTKYSLKAKSPADAKKWVWAIMQSQGYMKHLQKQDPTLPCEMDRRASTASDCSYLEPQLSSLKAKRLPISENPIKEEGSDMNLRKVEEKSLTDLLSLVQVQLGIQKTVLSSINNFALKLPKSKGDEEQNALPLLIEQSQNSLSATEAIISQILERYEREILQYKRKLEHESQMRKQWENVMQKVMGEPPAESERTVLKKSSLQSMTSIKSVKSNGDSDVFYDAEEDNMADSFIEAAFGFSALEETFPTSPRPIAAVEPESMVFEFISKGELKNCANGYSSLIPYRVSLPLDPNSPKPSLAIWSFLRSAIGKDLSKITLPVVFNEPMSMLQRMCEDVEYIELLSLASTIGSGSPLNEPAKLAIDLIDIDPLIIGNLKPAEASILRLMLVGAYAMSNYSSTIGRLNKPFNPALGETYELVREDKGFRYIAEQVCHHPPISACYCDSTDYAFWTEVNVKSKFWGKSLEIHPLGVCHVSLPLHGGGKDDLKTEHFTWKKVTTNVNIVGTLSLDHYGDMVIKNHRTGETCTISFLREAGGWFQSSPGMKNGQLMGTVADGNGKIMFNLSGNWQESLIATRLSPDMKNIPEQITLWKKIPEAPNAASNFNYTLFAMTLNQNSTELSKLLPLTDSRLRPDQRDMEHGRWDSATAGKELLETRQRKARKTMTAEYEITKIPFGPIRKGIPIGEEWWSPRWFYRDIDPDTDEEMWKFTFEYWKARKEGKFKKEDDIFGLETKE